MRQQRPVAKEEKKFDFCNMVCTVFIGTRSDQIGKLANWLKGSGSALLCLRPLVLITGKYNWGDGDEA